MLSSLACVLAAGAAHAEQKAYYSDFAGGNLVGLAVAPNGALSGPLPGTPAPTTENGTEGLVITPDARHLYVVAANARVFGFSIAADGGLSPVPGASFPGPAGNYGITVTPDGRYVYATDDTNDTIIAYARGTDGALAELSESPFPSVADPTGVVASSDGGFLYVASSDDDEIGAYAIGADGSLAELPSSPFATGSEPFSITLAPDGDQLYIASRPFLDDAVHAYAIAADGSLGELASSPYPVGGANPFGTTITPDGRHLYTANHSSSTITAFSVAGDGSLTAAPGSPFAGPTNTASVTTNAPGTRLFAVGSSSTDAGVFAIAANSSIAPIAGSPFTAASGDFQAIALTPSQPPTASFTVRQRRGDRFAFNGLASSDTDGSVARYDWDFGDGTTLADGGPRPTHRYSGKPIPAATLTVTDDDGCSTIYLSPGTTAFCNGSPVARISERPPRLRLAAKKRQALGRSIVVKARCGEPCTVRARGRLKLRRVAGRSKFKLRPVKVGLGPGETKRLALKIPAKAAATSATRGTARVTAAATDAGGNLAMASRAVKVRG